MSTHLQISPDFLSSSAVKSTVVVKAVENSSEGVEDSGSDICSTTYSEPDKSEKRGREAVHRSGDGKEVEDAAGQFANRGEEEGKTDRRGAWVCYVALAVHFLLMLLFTCAVFFLVHARRGGISVSRTNADVLVDPRNGLPLGVDELVLSTEASRLVNADISAHAKFISVIVSLPRSISNGKPSLSVDASPTSTDRNDTADASAALRSQENAAEGEMVDPPGQKDVQLKERGEIAEEKEDNEKVQHVHSVEAVEVRRRTNTTVLWMSGGKMLTVTPDKITLFSRSPNKIVYTWHLEPSTPSPHTSSSPISSSPTALTRELLPYPIVNFAPVGNGFPSSVYSSSVNPFSGLTILPFSQPLSSASSSLLTTNAFPNGGGNTPVNSVLLSSPSYSLPFLSPRMSSAAVPFTGSAFGPATVTLPVNSPMMGTVVPAGFPPSPYAAALAARYYGLDMKKKKKNNRLAAAGFYGRGY